MQVNDSSTAAARLYAQAAAPTGTAQPTPEADKPVPAVSTEDTVNISDEGMAKALVDNPGDWPEPPQSS